MHKTLRAIAVLFFLTVIQLSIFDGYFIPSQLYLFINYLRFETLCGSFSILSKFNATVVAY